MHLEEVVSDISAIKSGFIIDLVSGGKIESKVIIPEVVIDAIRREARRGNILALDRLMNLKEIADQVGIAIEVRENKKKIQDDDMAALDLAIDGNYPLVTSDEKMAKIAKSIGLEVISGRTRLQGPPLFTKFFSEGIMSVHLKEGIAPRGKIGVPGSWYLENLGDKIIESNELERIIQDIFERIERGEGILEIDREGSKILMLDNYRIIITFPPFSDKLEITITKKVVDLELEDYKLSPKLINRFRERAEGILIAGAPGMGKTTFARALAKFYLRENKIIKTIESPRDLCLPSIVTQYSKSKSSSEEIHDVLLLSRPDYTFFDEMRDTEDFKIFTDLRLAGVGMVGVIHAATPIDAIQRFIGRVELGMIPSIIDTVVFINRGIVDKVYELETKVKIPHGLTESDLTRPVVLVRNFDTNEVEYEIYVFGERTFVVPLKVKEKESAITCMINKVLGKHIPMENVIIEESNEGIIIGIPANIINYALRRCRKKIQKIEDKMGVRISIKPI
ncbi:MAG: ATPase, T2SS/T4P/T4SS family [Candidatus Methanomethyliaceae archaeon]|nr:ATPase, T2SS/T4P/T4SS family [Candidatus Methanomethyliaceae archaeon]